MITQNELLTYTPKEVMDQTGLSVYTLRYYEHLGLIDPVARASNGHRLYSEQDITRIRFLKRMRRTGMSIPMIQHYLELFRQGRQTIPERRALLEAHRRSVAAQLEELQQTLDFIDYKLDLYAADSDCTDGVKKENGA